MKRSCPYYGGRRYDMLDGNHRIVTDQPASDSDQDVGAACRAVRLTLLKVAHGCTVHHSPVLSSTVAIRSADDTSRQPAGNLA